MNLLLFLLTSYCYGELSSLPFSDCGDGFVLVGETDGEVEPECDEHECPQVDSCVTCKDLCDNDESCEAYECNFSEDKVSCSFNGHFALTEECGPLCESQKVCVKNSTEINGLNFISNGRRNLGTQKARCRDGYYDATNGNANWWLCGRGCPGGALWVDDQCQCACEISHLNLCSNGAGGSFPCSATMTRSEIARRACESVYLSCTQHECEKYKLWSRSFSFYANGDRNYNYPSCQCRTEKYGACVRGTRWEYEFIYETSDGTPTSFVRKTQDFWGMYRDRRDFFTTDGWEVQADLYPWIDELQLDSWDVVLENLGVYQSTKFMMKFSHGRAKCIQQGGQLATPRSPADTNAIKDTLPHGRNTNAWLGIQRYSMHWVHADGSQVEWTNWAPGNPGPHRGGAAVLAKTPYHNGKWLSWSPHAKNTRRAYVVCEVPGFYGGEHAMAKGMGISGVGRRALALTEEETLIETDAGTIPIQRKL